MLSPHRGVYGVIVDLTRVFVKTQSSNRSGVGKDSDLTQVGQMG